MNDENKKTLQTKFENLYEGCTLYAIHLDGFSHEVFYKDQDGRKHIDGMSAYAPEQYRDDHETYNSRGDMAIQSWNKDKTKVLFTGFPHISYQHNAKEYVYKDVEEW